jgi:hypothetical protein
MRIVISLRRAAFAAVLALVGMGLASGITAVQSPALAQGQVPGTKQDIIKDYELLKDLVNRAEEKLAEATKNGNAKQANEIRRNLQFYKKRLAALAKKLTNLSTVPADRKTIEEIEKLSDRAGKSSVPPRATPTTTSRRILPTTGPRDLWAETGGGG